MVQWLRPDECVLALRQFSARAIPRFCQSTELIDRKKNDIPFAGREKNLEVFYGML